MTSRDRLGSDQPYDRAFFDDIREGSASSARQIWPEVADLLAPHPPRTIVDVGCGDGTWLGAAKIALGIHDFIGVDGSYVRESGSLRIPEERFVACDLATEADDLTLRVGRRFDLAMSLEVAEHLPRNAADGFVRALVGLAPIVLFGAAIPNQGGESHLNEEWPEAWVQRFAANGYCAIDALRPRIWARDGVAFWYRQNTLLFASNEALTLRPRLAALAEETQRRGVPSLVHPELLRIRMDELAYVMRLHHSPLVRAARLATRLVGALGRFAHKPNAGTRG